MPRSLAAKTLSSRLDSLRHRGRISLLAALGAPEAREPEVLPRLEGLALAKHHLALAFEACQEIGSTKPQAFAKLRLLTNQLEQGRIPRITTVKVPSGPVGGASSGRVEVGTRRARLLVRAFQGANQIAEWRRAASEAATDMR